MTAAADAGPAMLYVRAPGSIGVERRPVGRGTFEGRWHVRFDNHRDPDFLRFGPLRVFIDDTMSPGAVWPLHPHREVEVVAYAGEVRPDGRTMEGTACTGPDPTAPRSPIPSKELWDGLAPSLS